MTRIAIYDTTLRDGSQGEGVNFSLQDKLRITERLDELGVDYIEGGYPLSNPKDEGYFRAVRDLDLAHARVAAFGMTRRKDISAEDDAGMKALVGSGAPVITIVGKSWDFQVTEVLGVSLDENCRMIADSVAFCVSRVEEVVYDAEHFFDGYRHNPDYALQDLAGRRGRRRRLAGPLRHQRRDLARRDRRRRRGRPREPSRFPSASTPTTTASSPWPTPWPRSARGPRRSRGRSTASASGAATSTSVASPPTSPSNTRGTRCSGPAAWPG